MYRRKGLYNSKRKLNPDSALLNLSALAKRVVYGGNPEHKEKPGDFGLTPPVCPRPDKPHCDQVGIFERKLALRLLREGVKRGMVSLQMRGGFPQNVWAVTSNNEPLEAQLENEVLGSYHGYPMPLDDPFREIVLRQWKDATG